MPVLCLVHRMVNLQVAHSESALSRGQAGYLTALTNLVLHPCCVHYLSFLGPILSLRCHLLRCSAIAQR